MSVYLYGVVRSLFDGVETLPGGVGDPPGALRLLRFRGLAAVVTEVPDDELPGLQVRGMRRDMVAHAAVVERVFQQATIAPMRFGVVLPDEETVIGDVLEAEHARLDALLTRLEDCVELTLKASYVEEQILREIAEAQPALARPPRRSGRPSRDARLEQGRQIAAAIRAHGERDAREMLKRLLPLARDVSLEEASSEAMLANAAFLVERPLLEPFDQAVQRFHDANQHRMRLEYVGPLPPYSFSRVELPVA